MLDAGGETSSAGSSHVEPDNQVETLHPAPNIEATIFFNHHNYDVSPELYRLFNKGNGCDIYIPELAGWRQQDLDELNNLSNGSAKLSDYATSDSPMGQFDYEQARMIKLRNPNDEFPDGLAERSVPIMIIDTPNGNSSVLREMQAERRANFISHDVAVRGIRSADELLQIVTQLRAAERTGGLAIREREEYMGESLKQKLPDFIRNHPELARTSNIRLLLSIGYAHTGVQGIIQNTLKELSEQGLIGKVKLERAKDTPQINYDLHHEALRTYRFAENPNATKLDLPEANEFWARLLVSKIVEDDLNIYKHGYTLAQNNRIATFLRKFADTFITYETRTNQVDPNKTFEAVQLFLTRTDSVSEANFKDELHKKIMQRIQENNDLRNLYRDILLYKD